MKKTLFFAWLVLAAMLVPTILRAEDKPKASLEAYLSGDEENPVLTIRLINIGDVPITVDRELVFQPNFNLEDSDGKTISREYISSVDEPKLSELEKRVLILNPGEKVERQVELRKGFKAFISGHGTPADDSDSDPGLLIMAYEAIYRLPEDARPAVINIVYFYWSFYRDSVWAYMYDVQGFDVDNQFYWGPLSVTVPYRFTGEVFQSTPVDSDTQDNAEEDLPIPVRKPTPKPFTMNPSDDSKTD